MIIQCDSRHIPLENESVNCIITSPPYWSLRKYDIPDVVWDGEEGCEHEWGTPIIKKQTGGVGKTDVGNFSDDRIHYESQTQFCLNCSAWRGQLGLEPTIDLYLKHLLQVMDECKRVLRGDGTMWVNLGDSYSAESTHASKSGATYYDGISGTYGKDSGRDVRSEHKRFNSKQIPQKSMCLIPERFAIEMVNNGWILRNKIIWKKPNCMPSSAKDRFTVDFEPVFFFVKNRRYFFEQQYEKLQTGDWTAMPPIGGVKKAGGDNPTYSGNTPPSNPQGRNRRCVWTIPTQPYPESHFATFPEALVEPMIRAGCPKFVCVKCGKAREKITKVDENYPAYHRPVVSNAKLFGEYLKQKRIESNLTIMEISKHFLSRTGGITGIVSNWETGKMLPKPEDYLKLKDILSLDDTFDELGLDFSGNKSDGGWTEKANDPLIKGNRKQGISLTKNVEEIGLTDCGCNAGFEPGIVFDPFAGSGTVVEVAKALNRIGIGMDIGYQSLSRKRTDAVQRGWE